MNFENITLTVEEGVATITFNRPKALNAMNSKTMAELGEAVKACATDSEVKSVILTGSGDKAFVAGADISEMQDMEPSEGLDFMGQAHNTLRQMENLSKPVIAAVNGYALGGGNEIALACDIRFASDRARFGQPEILLGIIPGWGGTQRLSRLVGPGLAKELIFSGEQISAQRAFEMGLVNRVVPHDDLLSEAKAFAKKLAGMPSFALKMAKQSITYGYDISLDNANRLELECCAQCFSTKDQKEGMSAFLEKRKPEFTGR